MRKQTKLVAVLSAAALLAIGASMTSFAATGWAEENGTWVYYDKNGDQVTDTWAKSGENWFYLDGNGEMSVDELIEDGDNFYYVDENGAMATNRWIALDNEDAGSDNEPQQFWYYFQANGKALQGPDDGKVSLKTINGKKYAFNSDGQMLYGWIKADDATIINDDEDAWQQGEYYFGDENDGAMAVGWKLLSITDNDADSSDQHWINPAFTDDEDQSRYFYFKTNGKKTKGTSSELKESTINGRKYGFDEFGRMVAEWSAPATSSEATSASSWKYFSDIESGARVTKGWFKVVPPENLNSGDFEDGSEGWYYADNNGNIYSNELKTINGKKYAFNDKGKMIDGLKFLKLSGNRIVEIVGNDKYDDYKFDTEDGFNKNAGFYTGAGYELYYFGGGDDGAMKTGTASIDIDGDKFNFSFGKSGSTKGVGKVGEDSKKLYNAGKLVTAGKDEKYQAVFGGQINYNTSAASKSLSTKAAGDTSLGDVYIGYLKYDDATEFMRDVANTVFDDGSILKVYGLSYEDLANETAFNRTALANAGVTLSDVKKQTGLTNNDKYDEIRIFATEKAGKTTLGLLDSYNVVNTSGKIAEKNTKCKDGDDTYYKLYNGKIVATYTEN